MHFPESRSYSFAASEHICSSTIRMFSTQSQYSPWHLFSKAKKNATFFHRAGSLPSAAASPRIDREGQGPAPARNGEKKSSDGFVEPAAPPGTASAEAPGPRLPEEQAKIQVLLLGAAVRGAGFSDTITLFLPCL